MKSSRSANPWIQRYQAIASIKEIRRRTFIDGQPVERLNTDPVEVACTRLINALKSVFVPTDQICEILLGEIETALAHAQIVYPNTKSVLEYGYNDPPFKAVEPYAPTCLTGLAGTGKTELRKALERLLGEKGSVKIDAGHGEFPLNSYSSILMPSKKSVSSALRPLARPEVASGNVRITEDHLSAECSQWQYMSGLCLFGADELQFMAQSQNASVLVSKVLLAFLEIRIPWHFVANYSLIWRLSRMPQQVTQRFLCRPRVLMPERPDSKDWFDILGQYQVVLFFVLSFELVSRAIELWNFSAGLKRELVNLLVIAYRVCRYRKAEKIEWVDIKQAYASQEYMYSRRDIELLIAHAGQGGELREDLRCPFTEGNIAASIANYENDLKAARAERVAKAAADSVLTVAERRLHEELCASSAPTDGDRQSTVVKMARKNQRSLVDLQNAGREFKKTLDGPKNRN